MKVFLFIYFLIFSVFSTAQDKKADAIHFAVTCGASAQTSPEIDTFKQLHERKDYKAIREKLFARNSMGQVLSAMLLNHYSSNGIMKLSKQEQEEMDKLAKSKRRFFLCFTCTYSEELTIKQLFARKKLMTYELVKGTMLNSF